MLRPEGHLHRLLNAPMRPGRVVWIGIRPVRRQAVRPVEQAELDPAAGLVGDHYSNRVARSRQITLFQREAIQAIAGYVGLAEIPPEWLRRNILVAGINLHATKSWHLRLGSAIVEITGECHPCSRMEEILGEGGYNAVRGHGGVTARIVRPGTVRVGDAVARIEPPVADA